MDPLQCTPHNLRETYGMEPQGNSKMTRNVPVTTNIIKRGQNNKKKLKADRTAVSQFEAVIKYVYRK